MATGTTIWRLFAAVHGELRRTAGSYMRRERRDHTPQPTALVHEADLRLRTLSPVTIRREIAAAKFWLGRRMKGKR